jgi:hypothetical protein
MTDISKLRERMETEVLPHFQRRVEFERVRAESQGVFSTEPSVMLVLAEAVTVLLRALEAKEPGQ